MSLREAVRVTLEGMEQDSKDADHSPETRALLKAYARELRAAFVAAESTSCVVPVGEDAFRAGFLAEQEAIARAERLAIRKQQQMQEQQEFDVGGIIMVLCVGGKSDMNYIPLQKNLVEGECMVVSGEQYIFRNGQLHLIL